MKRLLLAFILLFSAHSAYAQGGAVTNLTLSGDPIGSGYNLTNGQLFISTSASLQATAFPFSISFDALTLPGGWTGSSANYFLRAGEALSGSSTQGFAVLLNAFTSLDSAARVQAITHPAFLGNCDATSPGAICSRGLATVIGLPVLDGKRHHYCAVWTSTKATLYIDGLLRDQTTNVGSYSMGSVLWRIGNGFPQISSFAPTIYDMRVYSKALTPDQCVNINRLQQANLIPNSGTLNSDLILSLPLNNCVTVAPLTNCADASGHGNNATNDKAAPVVAITMPNAPVNPATGNIAVQATCTDPAPGLTCTQVCYLIDGATFSHTCPTTAPYAFSLDTSKLVDGVHQLSALGFNSTGVQGVSANLALTTVNSVSATTYFFDGTAGLDTNNCKSATSSGGGVGPCQTFAHLQTLTLLGGDTVSFKVGTPFPTSTTFLLCGGGSPVGCGGTQNFFPSSGTLTFTSYGGGTCNPFTLTTTNCATITLSGISATTPFEVFNGSNVVFENLALTGTTQSVGTFCGASTLGGAGIEIESTLVSKNITIQNNYLKNFGCHIIANGTGSEIGTIANINVTDNVAFNDPLLNPGGFNGIRYNNNASGTISGNLVYNIGGTANQNQGNCIALLNAPAAFGPGPLGQTIVEFNVGHDYSGNNIAGGGICFITFNSTNVIWQFNEAYNGLPYNGIKPGMFDFDGFDLDFGSNGHIQQYNYSHDNPVTAGFIYCMQPGSGQPWQNNQTRYNISENNAEGFSWCQGLVPTNTYVYNNTSYANLAPTGNLGALAGSCTFGASPANYDVVFANNLCIHDGTNTGAAWGGTGPAATSYVARNNDYWEVNGNQLIYGWLGIAYPSLSVLQATFPTVEVGSLQVNPLIAGSLPAGKCWVDGTTTPPAGPQPCPAGYQLTTGSPLIGVGLDMNAIYGINVGIRDYFGNSIPNGVGTGFNIGADGAHH